MSAADIAGQIDLLAERVEPYDLSAASRLRQLSRAFDYGELAEEWAATDIYRLIDPAEIVTQARNNHASDRWISLMELARNILLLVPIAVTWFGISRAVDGYYKLLLVNPELSQVPFIYLWQGGFGGQVAPTLGQLGMINAMLLSLVILLTAVALSWSAWTETVQDRRAEKLRRDLAKSLADASLYLQSLSRKTPTSLIEHFRDLAGQLVAQLATERMRITALAEERERELATLTTFSSELRLGTKELLDLSRSTGEIYRSLNGGITSLVPSVSKMAVAAEQLITVGQQVAQPLAQALSGQIRLGEQISTTSAALQQASIAVGDAVGQTHRVSNELIQSHKMFVADLQEQRKNYASLVTSIGQSLQSLTTTTQSFQQVASGFAKSVSTLTPSAQALVEQGSTWLDLARSIEASTRLFASQQASVVTELHSALNDFQATAQNTQQTLNRSVALFEHTSSSQDAFLGAVGAERAANAELSRQISAGTIEFESLAESIRQTALSLHAIAVDLSELRDSLVRPLR